MKKPLKTYAALSIGLFCLVITLLIFMNRFVITESGREKSRSEIIAFVNDIDIGMTKKEVRDHFRSRQGRVLSLREVEEEWYVTTPLELGASNWLLIITFAEGAVVGLRIRTDDDPMSARDTEIGVESCLNVFCGKVSPAQEQN